MFPEAETCCVCGRIAEDPYMIIRHLGNGKSRMWEGHKGCLFLVAPKTEDNYEYKEIDTPFYEEEEDSETN